MPLYLFRSHYTQAGIAGVMAEGGSKRYAAVETLVSSAGGNLIGAWWAFGDDDFISIAELPDHAAATTVAATIAASGAAKIATTVLLTSADIDEASRRHTTYRAPGR
jgi:uncharacterized protein with GYD domain